MVKRSNGLLGGVIAVIIVGAIVAWDLHEQPKNERRGGVIKSWNAYVEQNNAAAFFWNSHLKATSVDERRTQLRRCREAWNRVQPYEPLGVDPRQANAIAEAKKAWIERVDFAAGQLGVWWPDKDRATRLRAAVETAEERLAAAHNAAAAEVGGVTDRVGTE